MKILIALALAANACLAADWPNYRGPDHDGISGESGWKTNWPAEGPKRLWKTSVGTGFSSISIVGHHVYTMGNSNDQDTIYCFDAETGKEIWHQMYHCPTDPNLFEGGPTATPSVWDGKVFTLSRRGDVFCLDAATGKILWNKNLAKELGAKVPTWGFAGSPLVMDNKVYYNVGSLGVAVEASTGKTIWNTGAGAAGYNTPVPCSFNSTKAIALCNGDQVGIVETASGKTLWQYPWKTDYKINAADPILSGNLIFVSSGYEHGAALLKTSTDKTEVVWENKNMRNQISCSVLSGGFIYGMDGNNGHEVSFKCVELITGKIQWDYKGLGTGSFIVADNQIIALSDKGELVIAPLRSTAFVPTAHAQVLGGKCWTAPALSNGRIYCRNAKGDLVCLDVK